MKIFLLIPLVLCVGLNKAVTEDKDAYQMFEEKQCPQLFNHEVWFAVVNPIFSSVYTSLGIYQTLKDADLRHTNMFKLLKKYMATIQTPWVDIGFLRMFLELGGYLNYMSHDQDYDYYNNFDSVSYEYIFNEDRTGTVEEYIRFMSDKAIKYLEAQAVCGSDDPRMNELGQLKARAGILKGANETVREITKEQYEKFAEFPILPFYSFLIQDFFTYGSRPEWNEWTADKLSNVLNSYAFFDQYKTYSSKKAKEYVERGLPGGRDPFTFILTNPRVLLSPKVEPVLRMAMSRFVAENENFDKQFFEVVTCLLNMYGHRAVSLAGFEGEDLDLFIHQLNSTYEQSLDSTIQGMVRDPEAWIDFMDVVVIELERLNIDTIQYDIYAILLKFKQFLSRLDYDGQMAPTVDQLVANFQTSYLLLTCGKLPGLVEAGKKVLSKIISEKYLNSINEAFKVFVKEEWVEPHLPSGIIDKILKSAESISKNLGIKKNLTNFFKVEVNDDGKKYFKATTFLQNHQQTNLFSLLQPNLKPIDLRNLVKYIIKSYKSVIGLARPYFYPIMKQLVEDIELTPLDYGLLKDNVDRIEGLTKEIMNRVENVE